MNWVLLLVLLILGYNIIRGYRKGFLRIVYSLVSWVIVLTFVTVATPYINTYLMEHTTLYEKIEQQCSEQTKRSGEKQRSIQNESSPDNQKLSQFGIMLPDSVVNDIFEKTGNMAGEIIEQSGLYDEIAKQIAEFVVEGIAFLIALVAAWTCDSAGVNNCFTDSGTERGKSYTRCICRWDIRTDTGMDRVLHDSCDKYERNGKCPGCLHISEQIVKIPV